jgi:cellulose synthase/poly-beta-1,6-N-acetylglucosamine synthase-like glycosyltransferase
MAITVIHIIDLVLWGIMAVSVVYVLLFALASLLPDRKRPVSKEGNDNKKRTFLVLFPAYKEDAVIVDSVSAFLRQDYPSGLFHVAVISDHMQSNTNELLEAMPITLLTPSFVKSSKARALQYAIEQTKAFKADYVVILDADNTVQPDFLTLINHECSLGHKAIQCHRTAKNLNNDIAVLDGLSEEINNSIFRQGHNRIGLSSALIGSGMCFSYDWFSSHVTLLDSAVEDRELEAFLMKERIHVHYAKHIYVQDEKVSSHDNFQRQRLRWMTGQVQALVHMMPYVPRAIVTGNVNYLDKTLQQALIPRSILLVLIPFFGVVTLIAARAWTLKWWILMAALCVALIAAIPHSMRTSAILGKARKLPRMAWHMLRNLFRINPRNKEFLHTTHGKNN